MGPPLKQLIKDPEVGSRVKVVFKHFPLGFHKQAEPASRASIAAMKQGKFWEFHDKCFANQRALTEENFKKFLFGKITWAQLEGMTMEQAYAIAEFGYTMYQQGRYKDARTLFEGLVIGNPYDPYFHAMLGAIYTKLDLHEEAAQEFSIAIELDPEDINSYVNRGELLLQHGEFEYAMEDLKAAIDLDPEGKNPASLRARALAAATAAAIKELIEKKEAEGDAGGPSRGPAKPKAKPPGR